MTKLIPIGFWRFNYYNGNSYCYNYPWPLENKNNYLYNFYNSCLLLKDKINNYYINYNYYIANSLEEAYKMIDNKLTNFIIIKNYIKLNCKICHCNNNISLCILNNYIFPYDYLHYIINHNIYVPIEFQKEIIKLFLINK